MVQIGFLSLGEAFELFYERRKENRRYNFIGPFHPDHPIERNILAHEFGEVFKRGELLLYLEDPISGKIDRLEKGKWPETFWCRPLALYSSINNPLRTGVVPGQPRYHGQQPRVCEADFMIWERAHLEDEVVQTSPLKAAKRGRKPTYKWCEFAAEVTRAIEYNGSIDPAVEPDWTQAALERHMTVWCEKNWAQAPSESLGGVLELGRC